MEDKKSGVTIFKEYFQGDLLEREIIYSVKRCKSKPSAAKSPLWPV